MRVTWFCIAAAVVLLIFAPSLWTLGWHALHGETIQTRGKTVHVPLAWTATTTDSLDVSLTKFPKTIFSGDRYDGWIIVGKSFLSSCTLQQNCYSSWKAVYWNLAEHGAVISGPIKIKSGAQEIFCMQSTFPAAPTQVSFTCHILGGTWSADFRGDKTDIDTFLGIIQKIQ